VWRTWTYEDGLPRAEARHLFEDQRGVLWVATYGGGLGWIKDDQAGALPSRRGELYDRFLSSITLTKDNSVWLQGNKGVMRVRLSDLEAARLNPEHAIVTHHIKTGEANGWLRSSAAFTPDGSLWLAGVDRLSVVETSKLITDRPLPSPRIKNLLVGDTTLSAHPLSTSEVLTPKRLEHAPAEAFRRLEVSYATTTLEHDNGVSYEHRLVPLPQRSLKPDELNALRAEVPWVSAGSAQVAVFPQLHPGAYLFEVRSISLEHTASPSTQIAFKIPHKWHELLWVRALLGLALMALTTLLGLWRARLISQHNKQLLAEIKQREVVEAKLGAREAHYRQVFNQAANAFLLYNKQGVCVEVNPQANALFGASEEVLLACDPRLLGLPPLEHLAENREGEHTPLLCTRVDGGVFPARMSYVRCHVEGSEMWLVSVMDLSAIVTAHERQTWVQHQLAVARRMDALGRLASGIAHDLNNILGALAGNIELLGEDLPTDDPFVQESLSDVRESVVRGSALSQQLLAFSRLKSSQRPTTLDPIEVVRALEKLLHRLMPQGVTLLFDLKPVGELKLNRGTLEQVLLTLTLHAAEASPPDGEVRVRVELNGEGALSLLVEDSGPAIPLSALRSVLEGYREGGDIGVPALALVKRVITEAQGSLSVRRYGERNVVIVEWPSGHLTPLPHQNRERTQQAKRPDRSLNLVVVDDNHELRRALVRQLTSLGHAVEGFGDPLEALEALSARPTAPHILISDVIMPGMNGRQLANEVRRRFPQLPVLFISGYTSDVLGEVSMEGENEQLLHKPFTKEVLRRKLNSLAEASLGRSSSEHDEATEEGQKRD
jgi:PAS domain S-box-containing protein